jgi:hypothetical protein
MCPKAAGSHVFTLVLAQDAAALVGSLRETCLLHSWVQHRLSLFVGALGSALPSITQGGSLASVLEHATVGHC